MIRPTPPPDVGEGLASISRLERYLHRVRWVATGCGTASLSPLSDLANVLGRDVIDVHYLSAASAAQRNGRTANNGPVIVVRRNR
ncbi:MAG: hypothetical protein M3Z05_07730 [Gemmatimonadota bacterium]|nr:hypothetical protein [Gemmatimonadota bacterium]